MSEPFRTELKSLTRLVVALVIAMGVVVGALSLFFVLSFDRADTKNRPKELLAATAGDDLDMGDITTLRIDDTYYVNRGPALSLKYKEASRELSRKFYGSRNLSFNEGHIDRETSEAVWYFPTDEQVIGRRFDLSEGLKLDRLWFGTLLVAYKAKSDDPTASMELYWRSPDGVMSKLIEDVTDVGIVQEYNSIHLIEFWRDGMLHTATFDHMSGTLSEPVPITRVGDIP